MYRWRWDTLVYAVVFTLVIILDSVRSALFVDDITQGSLSSILGYQSCRMDTPLSPPPNHVYFKFCNIRDRNAMRIIICLVCILGLVANWSRPPCSSYHWQAWREEPEAQEARAPPLFTNLHIEWAFLRYIVAFFIGEIPRQCMCHPLHAFYVLVFNNEWCTTIMSCTSRSVSVWRLPNSSKV